MSKQKQTILKINNDYLKKVPRPEKNQYEALKESIWKKGQLQPIIINDQHEIIDGYTRFQICQELGIEPKLEVKKFKSKKDESLYVRIVNQKRRHLNSLQLYEMYEEEIEEIKQINIKASNQKKWDARKGNIPRNSPRMKYENSTLYRTMQLTGLSKGQIEGVKYLKRNADEEIINKVRMGKTKLFAVVNRMKFLEKRNTKTKKHRNGFQIIVDILNGINEHPNSIISYVSLMANLSHYSTIAYTDTLLEIGYLQDKRKGATRTIKITENGLSFLKKCNDIIELLPKRLVNGTNMTESNKIPNKDSVSHE